MADAATGVHGARYRRIMRFATAQFIQLWWFELVLPRFGMRSIADRTRAERSRRIARKFHALAVDLGGLMIKVGQFLSSRMDVLPPEITAELAGLQDEVPAVVFSEIRARIETELGMPLGEAFAWFEEQPLAAASLGQAHRARLAELGAADAGFSEVVVKVQRPGIDEIVAVDLAALRKIGLRMSRIRLVSDRVDAPALIEEFAVTSREEIDYLNEAANAERFAEAFAGDARVSAPVIAWERTTRRVLTMSDVTAIKVNDTDALLAVGIDPKQVAEVFAEVMFEQVFTHSFFHADPHPGNAFVTPVSDPAEGEPAWRLTFIDFGMMGIVPPGLRDGLRALLVATAAQDGKGLVAAVQQVGMLLPSADTAEFERAVVALFSRFGGMGFAELKDVDPREFQSFADEFGDTVRRLPFQLPEGLLLLFRAASLTSGVCSGLDPEFNVWHAVEPFGAQLIREESGNTVRDVASQAMAMGGTFMRLPQRVEGVIDRAENGTLSFDTSRLERRIERIALRILGAILFAGALIAGVLLLPIVAGLGIAFMIVSIVPLGYALFAGRGGIR